LAGALEWGIFRDDILAGGSIIDLDRPPLGFGLNDAGQSQRRSERRCGAQGQFGCESHSRVSFSLLDRGERSEVPYWHIDVANCQQYGARSGI
jgi:hypothetical protein